jgi:hypothetical protein
MPSGILHKVLTCSLFICLFCSCNTALARDAALDFRDGAGEEAISWLKDRNIVFERGAARKDKTRLTLDKDKGLIIDSLKEGQSIIALKKGHVKNFRDVVITWGVDQFPEGASYAKGRRNEAIMLQVFFGTENISSGSFIVPDAPYFIALHLCENDEINKPEKGRFYHKGGRFVCVDHPKPGETVTTRFDLKQAFAEYFGFGAPPLYAIALEFDTRGAPNGGKTSAFVKSIEFPAATYIND